MFTPQFGSIMKLLLSCVRSLVRLQQNKSECTYLSIYLYMRM